MYNQKTNQITIERNTGGNHLFIMCDDSKSRKMYAAGA